MMGNINNKFYLEHYLGDKRKACKDEIENLTLNNFKNSSDAKIAEKLYDAYKCDIPVFDKPNWTAPKSTGDYQRDGYGFRTGNELYTVNVSVPITGDGNLFYAIPMSGSTVVYLKREIHYLTETELSLTIQLPTTDKALYEKELNDLLNQLNTNIPNMKSVTEMHNVTLKKQIPGLIEEKKKRLQDWS